MYVISEAKHYIVVGVGSHGVCQCENQLWMWQWVRLCRICVVGVYQYIEHLQWTQVGKQTVNLIRLSLQDLICVVCFVNSEQFACVTY